MVEETLTPLSAPPPPDPASLYFIPNAVSSGGTGLIGDT